MEKLVPEDEYELYLDCLSGKPMSERITNVDLHDGCILTMHVYMKVSKLHPLKGKKYSYNIHLGTILAILGIVVAGKDAYTLVALQNIT